VRLKPLGNFKIASASVASTYNLKIIGCITHDGEFDARIACINQQRFA
jgi:hypothetical protein